MELLYLALTATGFLIGFLVLRRWLEPEDGGQAYSADANAAIERGRAEGHAAGGNLMGGGFDGF